MNEENKRENIREEIERAQEAMRERFGFLVSIL